MKQGTDTCGDHVAHRCHKFDTATFNLKDYQQHVYNYCKVYGVTPDELPTIFNINLKVCLEIYQMRYNLSSVKHVLK